MIPLLHAISVISASAAGFLFSAIWEGAVLAACAALCLRLLPGLSAAARSAVWTNRFSAPGALAHSAFFCRALVRRGEYPFFPFPS